VTVVKNSGTPLLPLGKSLIGIATELLYVACLLVLLSLAVLLISRLV
jgi:hypothetical protein